MSLIRPLILDGSTLRLQPLGPQHMRELFEAADSDLFNLWLSQPKQWTLEGFQEYMNGVASLPDRLTFAAVLRETGKPVASSTFFDVRPEHLGLEIGYTWISRAFQGTQVNPEMKYLMLRHAIETLGMVRVQLKTDKRNVHSQNAMLKLGAKREGVLRNHMILDNGYVRDTVMFSITREDWPEVKAKLEERLGYEP